MLITEDNAVFISSLLDPHAEHLVNLLMKSQLPRSITRGVGLLELFQMQTAPNPYDSPDVALVYEDDMQFWRTK